LSAIGFAFSDLTPAHYYIGAMQEKRMFVSPDLRQNLRRDDGVQRMSRKSGHRFSEKDMRS
jgi:hypothetical protein